MEEKVAINLKLVGIRIRNARQGLNLTQEQAAERTDITGQFWSLIETGRERGSVNTYMQIAFALDLTLDDLFYESADIMRVHKALSHDELLSDCTAFEKTVINGTILALKTNLLRLRGLQPKF